MDGGIGNYVVENVGDVVLENPGEGTDGIESAISLTLAANVENLQLTGTAGNYGYGNALDNFIVGNSRASKLAGFAGNDTLDGGTGSDRLIGGTGDDIYYVDNYNDHLVENAGEGTDTAFTSVNYKLYANVENLAITGSADLWAYGNASDNILTGNSGANKLFGMDGNDTLNGGAGTDQLTGGAGNDVFQFGNGEAAGDRITDFTSGQDRIDFSPMDANALADGDQGFAFLGTAAFNHTAGELRYEQISGNTYVSGDTDGDGVADFTIRLDGLHTLASGDFVL